MASRRLIELRVVGERADIANQQDGVELGRELLLPPGRDEQRELEVTMDVADDAEVAHCRGSLSRMLISMSATIAAGIEVLSGAGLPRHARRRA